MVFHASPGDHSPPVPGHRRLAWVRRVLACALALALVALCLHLAGRSAMQGVVQEAAAQAHGAGALNAALLRNKLDKFRAVPYVLTSDVDVRAALEERSSRQISYLNEKLDTLASGVGASVIYVLDQTGYSIAASNWREPDSFVGQDYSFRPYYRDATARGSAELFALGTVSNEPGMYLSRRVNDNGGRLLGVVVLKVDFRDLEADWRKASASTFVTDTHGIMLLGSPSGWRFHVLAPLPATVAQGLRGGLQFGNATFEPLPFSPALSASSPGELVHSTRKLAQSPKGTPFLHVTEPVAGTPGWTMHLLLPLQAQLDQAVTNARLATLLGLAIVAALAGIALYRRHRLAQAAAQQVAARRELESQVIQRTAQLRDLNAQLRTEIDEHQRTEGRLHTIQDELVQASKLALLGQVAAGVAHEVNQPVAAIRSYADNARQFLLRGDQGAARENLGIIAGLTERIGQITGQLRAFSRKEGPDLAAISLNDAIDSALLMIAPRTRRQEVAINRPDARNNILVRANRVKLEQVLVNLLQNSLDALEGAAGGRILISVNEHAATVELLVSDNGPGLAPEMLERIFTPFNTTRPEGLGLGLVISRDLMREFGGDLRAGRPYDSRPLGALGGAVFTLTLIKPEQKTT